MSGKTHAQLAGPDIRINGSPLTDVPFSDYAKAPYQSIGHLEASYGKFDSDYGTGFVIDSRHIMTAAHCVFREAKGPPPLSSIDFTLPDMSIFNPTKIFIPEELNNWPKKIPIYLDFAVLRFAAGSFDVPGIALEALPNSALTGGQILIAGWNNEITNNARQRIFQQAGPGTINVGTTELSYPISTLSAESGTVLAYQYRGNYVAIGNHVGGGEEGTGLNWGCRLTQHNYDLIQEWIGSN